MRHDSMDRNEEIALLSTYVYRTIDHFIGNELQFRQFLNRLNVQVKFSYGSSVPGMTMMIACMQAIITDMAVTSKAYMRHSMTWQSNFPRRRLSQLMLQRRAVDSLKLGASTDCLICWLRS